MPRPKFSDRFQSIVEWVENNIYLSKNTPIPGRIKLYEWQKGILEAYENPDVRTLALMMSSQMGKSVLILCMIAYHIGCSPEALFLVQPGIKTLERFIKEKLVPLLDDSPELASRVHRTQMKSVRPEHIGYDGGDIFMGYSGSPSSLRSVTTPRVFADEIDVYRGNEDTENPLSIIWQRTVKYGRRAKGVWASTPVGAGTSLIELEFNESSEGYFHVPCEHCGTFHYLDYDNTRDGKLYCPSCAAEIEEDERTEMVDYGKWEFTNPDVIHAQGFHINQLYSKETLLEDTLAQYKESNPRGFWTQVLGLPYRSLVDDAITPEAVHSLYSPEWDIGDGPMTIADADAVTAAVDIQANRLELKVCFWKGYKPRVERLIRIPMLGVEYNNDAEDRKEQYTINDEKAMEAWRKLNELLYAYQPDRIMVDRHFPSPDKVKYWAETTCSYWLSSGRMWLIVGTENSFNAPLIKRYPTPKEPYYASLSVDTGKEWVISLVNNKGMSVNSKEGAVPEDYALQLTAEELRWIVNQSGTERKKWVSIRRRNEALDLMVYNVCGRESLGLEFTRQSELKLNDLDTLSQSLL